MTGQTDIITDDFSRYVHTLGRGPGRSRSLSMIEAEQAFSLILQDKVTDVQLGAFFALLRMKGETPEELAGMTQAIRKSISLPKNIPYIQLDWPSYAAGRSRGMPLFIISALLLAQNGIPVVMHGYNSHLNHDLTPIKAVETLGYKVCSSIADVSQEIQKNNFAYIPLDTLSPKVQELIQLREQLGLRSCVNTLARMMNPFQADHVIQGVFHPGYIEKQQKAAEMLGDPSMMVFKGGGGEAERNPTKNCDAKILSKGRLYTLTLPAYLDQAPRRLTSDQDINVDKFHKLWNGSYRDDFLEGVIISTAAAVLVLINSEIDPLKANILAQEYWHNR